jgi:hypothetical protein
MRAGPPAELMQISAHKPFASRVKVAARHEQKPLGGLDRDSGAADIGAPTGQTAK